PSLKQHPLNFYLDYGLRVTLNTDNRLVSDTNLTDEYMLAINELGLDYADIKNIIINGFKSAFIPYRERVVLLNKALVEMGKIEEEELKSKIKLADNL
ncbi:MAG: adenosine deaminase, partial [Candidatus Cloacimonetes bacterium]|nr:adenosine deaminase [Candidatus Cloacimonadota bacterium]